MLSVGVVVSAGLVGAGGHNGGFGMGMVVHREGCSVCSRFRGWNLADGIINFVLLLLPFIKMIGIQQQLIAVVAAAVGVFIICIVILNINIIVVVAKIVLHPSLSSSLCHP